MIVHGASVHLILEPVVSSENYLMKSRLIPDRLENGGIVFIPNEDAHVCAIIFIAVFYLGIRFSI